MIFDFQLPVGGKKHLCLTNRRLVNIAPVSKQRWRELADLQEND
jgi:hypothetical protein